MDRWSAAELGGGARPPEPPLRDVPPSAWYPGDRTPRAFSLSTGSVTALVDVLVGLLEFRDPFRRASSSLTRQLAEALGREIGLDDNEVQALALSAVLRDLGRFVDPRSADATAELSTRARYRVERHVELGIDVLEGVDLPPGVRETIRSHHEWWDGSGYPDRLRGEDIPLGARILAVADAFSAMLAPRPHRLPRRVPSALRVLRKHAGRQFDPGIVNALSRFLSDPRRSPRYGLRYRLLVAHPDDARGDVLAMRLGTFGFLVESVSSLEAMRSRLRRAPTGAVLLAATLPRDELDRALSELRLDPRTAALPVLVVDAETAAERVAMLDAGADVCFPPGIGFAELRATVSAALRGRVGIDESAVIPLPMPLEALRGELESYPLWWVLQLLHYDGRDAVVQVASRQGVQGTIAIVAGEPAHARVADLAGEAALRTMLGWREGRFAVKPDGRAVERTIRRTLLEILLDQGLAGDPAAILGTVRTG